jgi:hypothetical protein
LSSWLGLGVCAAWYQLAHKLILKRAQLQHLSLPLLHLLHLPVLRLLL